MANLFLILINICIISTQITAIPNHYNYICSSFNTSCTLYCNETSSCNDLTINASDITNLELQCDGDRSCHSLSVFSSYVSSNAIKIECNGQQSCLSLALNIENEHQLSLNCRSSDSCIDTHITAPNASNIVINLFDSCTLIISIQCLNDPSICYIYCDNKYISISSNSFKLVSIVSTDICIYQQFDSSCSQSQPILRPCYQLNEEDLFQNMDTQVIWDIKRDNNCFYGSYYELLYSSNSSNECSITCADTGCLKNTDMIDASGASLFTMDCTDVRYWRSQGYGSSNCHDLDILCPAIYDETIASEHNDTNCIIHCNDADCHNINISVPQDGVLRMYCGKDCSNITIYGDYAQRIDVYCTDCEQILIYATYAHSLYLYSLINSTVYAEYSYFVSLDSVSDYWSYTNVPQQSAVNLYLNYSDNINIKCYHDPREDLNDTFACDSMNIFADNARNINLIADGRYTANNISLFATYAENINIEGFKRNSLIGSTIVAWKANMVNISCLGGYSGFSCVDSSFYLSSIQSIINCQGFGCVNISLFVNDTQIINDKYHFNINGCNQCHSLKECTNHWNILYINTHVLGHYINTTFIDDEDECKFPLLPTTPPPYVIEYDESYRHPLVHDISIMLSCIYNLLLFIIFAVLIYEFIRYLIKKCNKRYISKRPYDVLLWGSFCCEILIFIGMYWWRIKATLFHAATNTYCSATYTGYENGTLTECTNDPMCSYHGLWSYGDCECIAGDCECIVSRSLSDFNTAWWVFIAIFCVIEFARCIASFCHDYNNADYNVANNPTPSNFCTNLVMYWFSKMCSIHCVFCKYMFKDAVWRDTFYEDIFWKRRLWRVPLIRNKWVLFYYLCDIITRYGVHIMFGIIFWMKYSSNVGVADSGMKWYDIVPVLMLLMLKFVLQCYYVKGNEYDLRQDWPHFIDEILTDEYGDQIGWIIKFYLPIFHDEKLCESGLLITQKLLNRASNISDGVDDGSMDPSYLLMTQHTANHIINCTETDVTEVVSLQSGSENNDAVVDNSFLLQTQTESNTEEKVNDFNPLSDDYKPPTFD